MTTPPAREDRRRRGRPLPVAALLVAVASLAACSSDVERASITVAIRGDVTGFFPNPPIENEGFTFDINWLVFEGLTRLDDDLRLEPGLAESWTNPDDLTYVLRLRPGLRFSDGTPLDALDAAASLEAALRHDWVTRDYLQAIESVSAPDPGEVRIRTRYPYRILLAKLPWGLVLPAESVDASPVPAVGSGPYRLESREPGRSFVLTANPHYRGPAPQIETIRFVVAPDDERRVSMLLRGEVDLIDQVPPRLVEQLEGRPGIEVHSGPGLRVLFLAMRTDAPPFSDPRLREAVDLAIDRKELIERTLAGRAQPASQLVPPAIVGYEPEVAVTRVDRDRARRLLAEAGYAEGLSVRLDGPNNRYVGDAAILSEVGRQLAQVGIRVAVDARDKSEYFERLNSGESAFHLLGWACKTGEAGDALDALLHTPTAGRMGVENTTGFSNPELDALIDEANATGSLARRAELLKRAMRLVTEHRPLLPLLVQTEALAASRRLAWEPGRGFGIRLEGARIRDEP